MQDDLRDVWERYVKSWQADTAAEKRALFAGCLVPGCVYTDPLAEAKGWEELLGYMLAFHEQLPGAHFVTESFFAHHGRSVARWQMVSGAGLPLSEGISYAEYDEQQRLKVMTGFFDPPANATPA